MRFENLNHALQSDNNRRLAIHDRKWASKNVEGPGELETQKQNGSGWGAKGRGADTHTHEVPAPLARACGLALAHARLEMLLHASLVSQCRKRCPPWIPDPQVISSHCWFRLSRQIPGASMLESNCKLWLCPDGVSSDVIYREIQKLEFIIYILIFLKIIMILNTY